MATRDEADGAAEAAEDSQAEMATTGGTPGATNGDAIRVRDLVRGYGSLRVLEGLDATVPRGAIYSLLGPSGCGKTTLLKVLLGQLRPTTGDVDVLGATPGVPGAPVPGSSIGYAPQEIALYLDLSIDRTLRFHSRLHRMTEEHYETRLAWLTEFLDLPPRTHIVGNCSGGERRRVSLAVALLHEPELLLLDEPTVGVDPELRYRIWEHLRTLADEGITTVITTHYVEEARAGTHVAMMRNGVLLAEQDPESLIVKHGAESLEEVFLELCRRQDDDVPAAAAPVAEEVAA